MYRAFAGPASLTRMNRACVRIFPVIGFLAETACAGASQPPPSRSVQVPSATVEIPGGAPALATPPKVPAEAPPTVTEARAFVDDVEAHLRKLWIFRDRAAWINDNFITDDTEALAAEGEERTAAYVGDAIRRSRKFVPIQAQLPPDVARKLYLLSVSQTIPAPSDPTRGAELADIETWMTNTYGKGKYCPKPGSALISPGAPRTEAARRDDGAHCLTLDDLSRILAKTRDVKALREAWDGWHSIAVPLKSRYARYVELANEGARDIGFSDVGALWRAGYDRPAEDFERDVERLWAQVKPLYDALHCYVRSKLQERYGKQIVPDGSVIPSELLGNMWAQEWNNIYDLVSPYPKQPAVDVTAVLRDQHWDARKMVKTAEAFFTSLGFEPLPATFWERSLFTRPRDRDVVCHASAWDVTWSGDLRIKMCIEPTEEDLVTIHHELGHDFYFQRYDKLPILFQQGANDGFHEAIGDTMALSVTPEYLKTVGLVEGASAPDAKDQAQRRINQQMKMALDKVAFLPFGLLIDKWRWEVFSGKITPEFYNAVWWDLKKQYQGVGPASPRGDDAFDPGAKFHVAASTPYVRYFLARIYQFQFHRALCRAAGYSGPLDECSIHGNKAAGAALAEMLSLGASRPWPDALETLGAGREADASAMLDYFAPLARWLSEQNRGQACGW
jgi:peptidyl-dipeptidase A